MAVDPGLPMYTNSRPEQTVYAIGVFLMECSTASMPYVQASFLNRSMDMYMIWEVTGKIRMGFQFIHLCGLA